jgi:hypothetical protein
MWNSWTALPDERTFLKKSGVSPLFGFAKKGDSRRAQSLTDRAMCIAPLLFLANFANRQI